VKVAEAASEPEAAAMCGFLESRGIRATYDKGGTGQLGLGQVYPTAFVGRQEILVRAEDAEAARRALAETQS
jgi:hypothetical protein